MEAKNIHSNRPSKKLDQKRYGPFKILKAIGQGAFQLKLLERWMIYNVFNEDLLTQCQEPYYKGQHMKLAPPPDISMKKKSTKWKKLESIERRNGELNSWYTGKDMEMNMING